MPNIHRFKKIFHSHTQQWAPKSFLIRLLTTPPHLKYIATLPCISSLMACLADIKVHKQHMQGAVEFLISI